MTPLSRHRLQEDLYNVGAFVLETYGAFQIQTTGEDLSRDVTDSDYFWRVDTRATRGIHKYYLVVGEDNFMGNSATEWMKDELPELYRASELEQGRDPDRVASWTPPSAYNHGYEKRPTNWGYYTFTSCFDWYCYIYTNVRGGSPVVDFNQLIGMNSAAETFRKLAQCLTDKGIKTPLGRDVWSAGNVQTVMKQLDKIEG